MKVVVDDRIFQIEPSKIKELVLWLENNTKEVHEEEELIIDIEDTAGVKIEFDDSPEVNNEDPNSERQQK